MKNDVLRCDGSGIDQTTWEDDSRSKERRVGGTRFTREERNEEERGRDGRVEEIEAREPREERGRKGI